MAAELDVYDHVRPRSDDLTDGVYRVVGTSDETVTLLRVGDAEGRRVHTGEIESVERAALADAEPVDNPDSHRSLGTSLAGFPRTLYWQCRTFAVTLAANPIPATIAAGILLIGSLDDPGLALPEPLSTGLVFAGALGLAVVGSGRL